MQLLTLGLNHTTAPLAVRERGGEQATVSLAELLERFGSLSADSA